MANLNKIILIGRLTGNPECRSFSNGGKVAKFSFAVNNRKKNSQTGEWEDDPMFIDCEAFNRGDFGKLADTVEKYCQKGSQICVEGRLVLDKWDDKTTGQKRSKHKVVIESLQLLDRKQPDGMEVGEGRSNNPAKTNARSGNGFNNTYDEGDGPAIGGSGGGEDEVPF
jgi:single-strand DNA-binding protein